MAGPLWTATLSTSPSSSKPNKVLFVFASIMTESDTIANMPEPTPPSPTSPKSHYSKHIIVGPTASRDTLDVRDTNWQ